MNIPPSTSNNQIPSPRTNLPPEVKADIAKRVSDTILKETATKHPRLAEREAARGLAKLNFVDKDLRGVTKDVMNQLPDTEMAATSMSILNMAKHNQFRERFVRLLQRHNHIEVPFSCLPLDEQKFVLDELSRKKVIQPLKKVKLDLRGVTLGASQTLKSQTDAKVPQQSLFQNLLTTIHAMRRDGNQSLDIDLDLSNTTMNDQDVTALAEVLPQYKVSSLALSDNKIGDKGATAIARALPDSPLTSLDLSRNQIGDESASAIALALLADSPLTSLALSETKIGDKGASAIALALPHSPLINLDLSYNFRGMSDKGAIAIADALPSCSSLTSLNMSGNVFGGESVIAIARALPDSPLTRLALQHNDKIGDEGASAIAHVLPHSPLTSLNVSSNQIGDEGASAIAKALPDSPLTSLNVSSNQIGDEGASAIAKALPDSPLTSLNLRNNKIKDDGARDIARALLANSPLTSLNLHHNEIKDGGAIAIAQAVPASKLTSLDLRGNMIRDEITKGMATRIAQRGPNPPTVSF